MRTFSQANVGAFLECFKHTLDTFESMRNASSVVVYLMADQDDVRMRFESQFIKEFGGNPKVSLLTPKDLFSTAHSLTERPCSDIRGLSREEAKQCMFRTLAELMIYSECDFLIQTARSTFSMVADTFRGRLRQYYGALKLGERSIYHSWVVWPTEYDANEAFTRVSSIATHVNSSNPTLKYLKTNKSLLLPGVCACIATLEPIRNTPIVVSDPDCISTSKRPSETERLF